MVLGVDLEKRGREREPGEGEVTRRGIGERRDLMDGGGREDDQQSVID